MVTHYSDRCLKVLDQAAIEALMRNRSSIGTEHILLALIDEGTGAAATMLRLAGVLPGAVRREVERLVPSAASELNKSYDGPLLWCPSVQQTVDLAVIVAKSRGHFFVGNQHLLLALLQQHGTVAARVLAALEIDCEALRGELLGLLAAETQPAMA